MKKLSNQPNNRISDISINRIQNSLRRLQTTISNNNIKQNRPKFGSRRTTETRNENPLINVSQAPQTPIGYSMFKNSNSILNTEQRNKINRQDDDMNFELSNYSNIGSIMNNERKTNMKWKCLTCGNINLSSNSFCINCDQPVKESVNVNANTDIYNVNNKYKKNSNRLNSVPGTDVRENNSPIENVNLKKLNDLYSYGDYLEIELKKSNDSNIKYLENYRNINKEYNVILKQNKELKKKINELREKDKQLNILNNQLKSAYEFMEKKNQDENAKFSRDNFEFNDKYEKLKENNQNLKNKQNDLDNIIENMKNKITELNEDSDDKKNQELMQKILEQINQEKKEINSQNEKYLSLIKNNDLLSNELETLKKQLDEKQEPTEDEQKLLNELNQIKEKILLKDKEISDNKENFMKLIAELSTNELNEEDENNYLLLKEKNKKLATDLDKLDEIKKRLIENKEKIVDVYEVEVNKLKIIYEKMKEKTNENDIQKLIEENDRLKKENFEYIKSLDELNELNESYQNLIKENEKLKNNGNENRLEMLDDKINSDDINDNEESN